MVLRNPAKERNSTWKSGIARRKPMRRKALMKASWGEDPAGTEISLSGSGSESCPIFNEGNRVRARSHKSLILIRIARDAGLVLLLPHFLFFFRLFLFFLCPLLGGMGIQFLFAFHGAKFLLLVA